MAGWDGPDHEPDRPRRDGVFAPAALTSDHPPAGRWILLIAIGLAIAVIKPWDAMRPEDGRSASADAGAAPTMADEVPATAGTRSTDPAASIPPTSAGPLVAAFCLDPASWLVASVEVWRDQTVRVWRSLEPATAATGPDDPTIPVIPIVSEGVQQLGWCAPVVGAERPVGVATMDVWRVTAAGPVPAPMARSRPEGAASGFGALYAPPPARPERAAHLDAWPDGRFIFRHRSGDGRERWFAIELEQRARLDPVP
jgi:hypothetical protein